MLEALNGYRNMIIGVVIISILFGFYFKGHVDGERLVQTRWDADKAAIANEAAKQAAINTAKVIEAQKTTEIVSDEYEQKIAQIKSYYAGANRPIPSRLCNNAAANSGTVSTVPNATKGIDAGSADKGITETDLRLDTLEASCAETTQQLVSLQNWIKLQKKNNP